MVFLNSEHFFSDITESDKVIEAVQKKALAWTIKACKTKKIGGGGR